MHEDTLVKNALSGLTPEERRRFFKVAAEGRYLHRHATPGQLPEN